MSLCKLVFVYLRTQRNTLWLVDADGTELEEILLDPADYCAYSAIGTATVFLATAPAMMYSACAVHDTCNMCLCL